MSERGKRLLETADAQIDEVVELLAGSDEAAVKRPCPGREKLGDGSVAACALHTTDNYRRMAGFLRCQAEAGHGGHPTAASADTRELLDRLAAARSALSVLGGLTDEQLDTVPPASGMRFCDGQRNLEQVLKSMLRHQGHQVDALAAALA